MLMMRSFVKVRPDTRILRGAVLDPGLDARVTSASSASSEATAKAAANWYSL
jgi:hypothetical protein